MVLCVNTRRYLGFQWPLNPTNLNMRCTIESLSQSMLFFFVQMLCINLYLDVFIYGFRVKVWIYSNFFQRNIYIYLSLTILLIFGVRETHVDNVILYRLPWFPVCNPGRLYLLYIYFPSARYIFFFSCKIEKRKCCMFSVSKTNVHFLEF